MPTVAPASTTKMMPYPLPPINESAFRTVQSLRSAIGTTRTAEPERSLDKPARLAMSLPLKPVPERIELSKRVLTAEQEEKLQAAMVQLEQQKAKRTKETQQVENQLSLFDSVA